MDTLAVRAVRAEGEPKRVVFDPRRHVGIIKRLLFLGASEEEISAILGVSPATLRRWYVHYEALAEVREEAVMAPANVAWRIYQKAMGTYNAATGEYEGGDDAMLRFLAERRYGWSVHEVKLRAERAARDEGLDDVKGPERLQAAVERVVRLVGPGEGSPGRSPEGGHGTPG